VRECAAPVFLQYIQCVTIVHKCICSHSPHPPPWHSVELTRARVTSARPWRSAGVDAAFARLKSRRARGKVLFDMLVV